MSAKMCLVWATMGPYQPLGLPRAPGLGAKPRVRPRARGRALGDSLGSLSAKGAKSGLLLLLIYYTGIVT